MDVDEVPPVEVPGAYGMDAAAAAKTKAMSMQGSQFSEDLLRMYYQRIFPYDAMFRWLSYFNDPDEAANNSAITADYFARREIR